MSYIRPNGKEIFSEGYAYYVCKACGQTTIKYFENHLNGIVPCEVCHNSVIISYFERVD